MFENNYQSNAITQVDFAHREAGGSAIRKVFMNQPLVGRSVKKRFSQFLSATLAFTTTVSLSGFALMFALTASAQVATLSDGDVVKTAGNPDVYIVTTNPHAQYAGWKRLILNPEVFNLYGHLSWSKIKTVSQATIDAYHTSALVRGENDPKVYVLAPNGDVGTKTWITSEAEFLAAGYSWSQIAQVNNKERDMYTDASQQPVQAPVGTGLSVSLASNTAAAGSIVADSTGSGGDGAQAQASMLTANFAAGNDGDVTVTTLKVKRGGISADADIANAYLYDGANRIAEMTNISSTYISFVNASGLFTVSRGTSKAITVKMDLTNGTSSGKTISLAINAASDVVAGSAAVSGVFPITGNSMTTATVSDLGKITIANVSPSAATTVDPGQTGYEVWRFSVAATDQKVSVSKIKVTNVGSVATTDLTNVKLMDGSVQLGATAATLAVDGTATFDMSANPLMVTAGQTKNLSVVADIVGGTTRTYRFSVQRSSDIVAMDTNYGISLKPNQTDSFSVIQAGGATTINSGSLTISVDPSSPNGNVAADYTDQELARFTFKANGEAVKVTSLTASSTGSTAGGINNAKLYLDGTQVGVTADLPAAASVAFTFGNSFIVPAGATKTLVVKAEVKKADGTSFSAGNQIQVQLVAGSSNAQGQTSLQSISTSAATANTLTVQTGTLTTATNTGMADATSSLPTGVRGSTNTKIGSFLITAGSGEGAEVSQIVVKNSATAGLALGHDFQNLTLKNGSTQIGTTVGSLSTTASNTYTFTPSPAINLAAGQQYVVDVYADVLTGASNYSGGSGYVAYVAVILDSVTATGKSTNSDASSSTDRNGQNVYVASTGSLTVAAASDMPIAQNRAMGQTGQTLATFKLTTGTQEGVAISQVVVTDTLSGTASAATGTITNLSLWNSAGVQVGSTVASMSASSGMDVIATFSGLNLQLAKDKSEVLTLKGDVNSYPNGVSGSYHTFSMTSNASITATGATSGQSITMTGSGSGNAQRAYRAELTAANEMSSFSGGQGTDQNIGKFRLTNTSAGNYTITVTDMDIAISSTITKSNTATRYLTLKRDSVGGTTVAKKAYAYAATAFSDATDLTSLTTAYDASQSAFSSFTIDASNGTGYVDIYVLLDTNDAASTKTVSTALGSGSNVVTWSDGVSSNITSMDGTPVNGATVTY